MDYHLPKRRMLQVAMEGADTPDMDGFSDPDACDFQNADQAFMFLGAAFVFLQIPGGALAQAGMLRRKSSLSIIMQTFTGFMLCSVLWWVVGFSMTFGEPVLGGFIGHPGKHAFWIDVDQYHCYEAAPSISSECFALFQMFFAIMTPVLVAGAWAEKMRFEASIVFFLLFSLLVYYPIAHAVWGGGWLAEWGPVLDFAGGVTIHTVAGSAAIVVSLVMKKRSQDEQAESTPHNVPLSVIGGTLIIVGWFFFNGASTFAANPLSASVYANTYYASVISGLTWMTIAYIGDHHFHMTEILNGMFAGLAGITPCSGFVDVWAAFLIGITVGICSYFFCRFMNRMKIDDVLDVAALQGAPGVVGSLCCGLFCNLEINSAGADGLFMGGGFKQLGIQLVGVLFSAAWTATMTYGILMFLKHTMTLELTPEEQAIGADRVQHEGAYEEAKTMEEALKAAAAGDMSTLKVMNTEGTFDFNLGDYDFRTALHLACSEGHLKVVQFLVEDAKVNMDAQDRYGNAPVWDAVHHNHIDIAKYLIAQGCHYQANTNMGEYVCKAAATGDEGRMQTLIDCGFAIGEMCDYDNRTALHLAAADGKIGMVKMITEFLLKTGSTDAINATDRWNNTPLGDAMRAKHESVASYLKDKGASINESTDLNTITGVCFACANNDMATMESMISQHGSHIVNMWDYDRRTPLHLAAAEGHLDMIKYLLKNGARVHIKDRAGKTAFEETITNKHMACMMELKKAGAVAEPAQLGSMVCEIVARADLEELEVLLAATTQEGHDISIAAIAADYDGRTGLHVACCRGLQKMADMLQAGGAKLYVQDNFGRSPADELNEICKMPNHPLITAAQNMSNAYGLTAKKEAKGAFGHQRVL